MPQNRRLSELKPDDGPARVLGFVRGGEGSVPVVDLLMSFGVLPGLRVICESRLPFSESRIFRFESNMDSWRGALRADEAAVVEIQMESVASPPKDEPQ